MVLTISECMPIRLAKTISNTLYTGNKAIIMQKWPAVKQSAMKVTQPTSSYQLLLALKSMSTTFS